MMKDCEVSVIESRALAGYDEDAQVQATFVNTDILTVQMVGTGRCLLVLYIIFSYRFLFCVFFLFCGTVPFIC